MIRIMRYGEIPDEQIFFRGEIRTDVEGIVVQVCVFALVVGLFLIYMYEHDNMLDHHKETDGLAYITLTGWIILIIGNLTVALEYMPMDEVAFTPKSCKGFMTRCPTAARWTPIASRYTR